MWCVREMRRQSRFPFKKPSRRFDFGNQDPKNIIRVVLHKLAIFSSSIKILKKFGSKSEKLGFRPNVRLDIYDSEANTKVSFHQRFKNVLFAGSLAVFRDTFLFHRMNWKTRNSMKLYDGLIDGSFESWYLKLTKSLKSGPVPITGNNRFKQRIIGNRRTIVYRL